MAKNIKDSSKYKDIISKCDPIHSGPPAIYQLKPKKNKIGTLARVTIGEKNPNKTNKTILLVGETGTGKSTLINALVNYTMGVKWEDEVCFQIVEEETKTQCKSQTLDVIVYEIFGFEDETLPYSVTIIDTPGYGDTRGTVNDDIISRRLFELFQSDDGVHEVNVVGLVMKATDNRLCDRLIYILDSVMSLFGKNLEKSIVALITHSNGNTYKNAIQCLKNSEVKCATTEKNQPVYFLFDNYQHEDLTKEEEEVEEELQYTYKKAAQRMKKFIDFLGNTKSQKLKLTADVLDERIKLTACIQNLKDRIKVTELKQRDIGDILEALRKHREKMNDVFTVETNEPCIEKKHLQSGTKWWFFYSGATCCTVCKENCHYPGCTKALGPELCAVMKWGCCTVCTNKCPASVHVKENWIYETKTKKVKKTLEEIKQKYEKNHDDLKSSLEEILEKKMEKLTAEESLFLDESYQHIVKLEQLALKADSASTIDHLDFLTEKMKERGDTEKVQKLEEIKSRVGEGTRAALQYKQRKKQS